MEEIRILLHCAPDQKLEATNGIITNYNLPFNASDINKAFSRLQCAPVDNECVESLIYLSLTTNLRMFIAIVYALLRVDNGLLKSSYYVLVTRYACVDSYALGCRFCHEQNVERALKTWTTLYDCYEFDISELTLSQEIREGLQKHIDSKVAHTKPAIKRCFAN